MPVVQRVPTNLTRNLVSRVLAAGAVILGLLSTGCETPEERDLSRGLAHEKVKDFKAALTDFHHAILRNPQSSAALIAAKEGAKVALLEIKDFKEAVEFFQLIVIYSNDVSERITAQKQLAAVYFDQLTDYPRAIEELNKLLATNLEQVDRVKYKTRLAKAYFYTNNFIQAESEVNAFLKNEKGSDEDSLFQMMLLKGNIYLTKKEQNKAIEAFRELLKVYPERSVKENAAMTLAVAYEEMKDYKNAISVLEQMKQYHATPEYIDLRIKKLLADQKNQPGAKGVHHK